MVSMKEFKSLGNKSEIPGDPEKFKLESITNPHQNKEYVIRLSSPEFTSICPITGQPDFGNIIVDYIPNKKIVESKSYKLFLFSFRNFAVPEIVPPVPLQTTKWVIFPDVCSHISLPVVK